MSEFLQELFLAVVTAAVPTITAFIIVLIKRLGEKAATQTEDTKVQGYITEIANAISDAVAATNQTYVDALKSAGSFTKEAQAEAASKALAAAVAAISPAAQAFIAEVYGDLNEYLTTKIEAEVRSQKLSAGTPVTAVLESTTDTTAIAASTAAATAATIAQTAICQLNAEPAISGQPEQTE